MANEVAECVMHEENIKRMLHRRAKKLAECTEGSGAEGVGDTTSAVGADCTWSLLCIGLVDGSVSEEAGGASDTSYILPGLPCTPADASTTVSTEYQHTVSQISTLANLR
jgi:hypothetical protein